MPDDEIQVAEHEEDVATDEQDFDAGFDDEEEAAAAESENDGGDEGAEPDGENPNDDSSGNEDAGDEGGEKELTAEERVAKRAAELEQGSEGGGDGKKKEPEPEKDQQGQEGEQDQQQPTKLTREMAAATLEFFSDVTPEESMYIGDKEINFRALEEDVPGITDAMRLTSGRAAVKLVNALVDNGSLVSGEKAQQMVQTIADDYKALKAELDDMRFWSSVPGHPDAINKIGDPELVKWVGEQKPAVQKLAKSIQTPQDAADILDMFAESVAKGKAKEHDDKSRKALQREKDLHGGTLRPGGKAKPSGESNADDEFGDGFDEA